MKGNGDPSAHTQTPLRPPFSPPGRPVWIRPAWLPSDWNLKFSLWSANMYLKSKFAQPTGCIYLCSSIVHKWTFQIFNLQLGSNQVRQLWILRLLHAASRSRRPRPGSKSESAHTDKCMQNMQLRRLMHSILFTSMSWHWLFNLNVYHDFLHITQYIMIWLH